MDKNFYDSKDKKYKKVIDLLNSLPKVKPPDNFEYNLKVRIENKNFDINDIPEKTKNKYPALIPGFAFILTIFALVYFFTDRTIEVENPFTSLPDVRSKITAFKADTFTVSNKSGDLNDISPPSESRISSNKGEPESDDNPETYRVILHPNDVVQNERVPYPFDTTKTVNVDSFIGKMKTRNNNNSIARLVGSHPEFDFNGFYTKNTNKKEVGQLKAKIDSVKRQNVQNRVKKQDKKKLNIEN